MARAVSFFFTFRRYLDVIRWNYLHHDVQHRIKPLKLTTLANRSPVGDGHTFKEQTNSCTITQIYGHYFMTWPS